MQRQRRFDEREAAVEVVADDEARHDGVASADPKVLGLVHDVPYRGDETVFANSHAMADALRTQEPRAHRVLGHVCRDGHQRAADLRCDLDTHGNNGSVALRVARAAANPLNL